MVRAVIQGYQDHMFDQQCNAVMNGYWTGYYLGAKRAKPPAKILNEMLQAKQHGQNYEQYQKQQQEDMDARVKQFQEREERLRRFLENGR